MSAPRYTTAEIAEVIGVTKRTAERRAEKEVWFFEEVAGRGGKARYYPIATLPRDIQAALQKKAIAAVLPVIAQEIAAPIVLQAPEAMLTDRQRLERDARLGVKAAIQRTMVEGRCSQESALHTLLTNARSGNLDPTTERMLRLARDPRGRSGDGFPSLRTLKRWLSASDLAPKIRQKEMQVPAWGKPFLDLYRQPQKPSVESAYRSFCEKVPAEGRPSIHQVRRFLAKLGTVTRERGRMGDRELKNIQPFVRRDFSLLEPNDVWSADGHTFDAEVQHPFHGRPFRPEITTFVDIATRRAVGWSVALAESSLAVADALRSAVEKNGIPALIYVDNGSGYRNAFMQDESTGLIGRIGSSMTHSLPYNSQARGVIERLHQTLWVDGAKQLPTYMGAAMDREARLQQFKLTRKAIKSGGVMPLMPWHVFVEWCEQRIAEYNARKHRSLGGASPDLALHAFEAKGWEPHRMTAEEMATLFRPRVTRTLARAEIRLFNNIYFARELEEFHGLEVHVAYDIHDAERIWVYTTEGRLLCEAQVNGNSKHYYPVPVVEQGRQERAKGRLARVDAKREEILEEMHGGPALAAPAARQVVIGGRIIEHDAIPSRPESAVIATPPAKPSRPAALRQRADEIAPPVPRSERPAAENYAEWLALDARLQAGEPVSDADARWHRSYPHSAQYRAEAKKKAAA
ncbi:Mu transposase C-terminal domain-containing protein [Azonexus sp.]|uniref:Mu transposase C-terminal domain-containing protein n=1 Tax=Azonexus sp. TaxID=1872668 RepID=UPI0035B4EA35